MVLREKKIVLWIFGFSLMVGLVLCFVLPTEYLSTAKILTPERTPSMAMPFMNQISGSSSSAFSAMAGGGLLRNPNDTYLALLKSKTVADSLLDQYKLKDVFHSKYNVDARKRLARQTTIVSEKEGLISITYEDRDKQRACDVTNGYVKALQALTKSLAFSEAAQRLNYYETELEREKKLLDEAKSALIANATKTGIVQEDAQTRAIVESIAQVQLKIIGKEVEISSQRTYASENNSELIRAERELESLKALEAHLKEQGKRTNVGDLALGDMANEGAEHLSAEHMVVYHQALYDQLLRQEDMARLDESRSSTVIQVVDSATPAERRSSPMRFLIMLIAAALGLLLGCGTAIVRGLIGDFDWRGELRRKLAAETPKQA